MIRSVRGQVLERGEGSLTVEAAGIGYLVLCPPRTAADQSTGEEVQLWTYTAVSSDQLTLYGFRQPEELALFERLLTVSGVGPKRALAILAAADHAAITRAIASGDTKRLIGVIGGGKKNAEKIILELSEVLSKEHPNGAPETADQADALDALTALGYSAREAREALQQVSSDINDTAERVRAALKHMP